MNIINKVLNEIKSPSDPDLLKKIKDSQLPLVLWGASKMAKFISRILYKNGISVSAIFTDYPESNETFNGMIVSSFYELSDKFIKFNILVAHGEFGLVEKYRNFNQVENIFTLFDWHDLGFSLDDKFLNENSFDLNNLYDNFSDKLSKDSFDNYITSRATNNWDYIRSFVRPCQYFPDFFELEDDEIFVDCGAFTGDTLLDFINQTKGCHGFYYAVEPSPTNANNIKTIVETKKISNIRIVQKAVWNSIEKFSFEEDMDSSHFNFNKISDNNIIVCTDLIDNICSSQATFIKMDVEGSELMALKGAAKTIQLNKPKLAISIYHKSDDLITIPKYLKELHPDYKFYFRLHNKLGSDAILYAI
jgi:FkbM family methyltransferase